MVRRLVGGTLVMAALAGSMGLGAAAPAQAQVSDCRSWLGSNGPCTEAFFNQNPDPLDIQLAQAAAATAQAAVQATQPTSQAASQTQAQPAGEE